MPSVSRLTPKVFMDTLRSHCLLHRSTGMVAFHTMEIYGRDGRPGGGGLGTLSKDWLRECADQGLPVVGVTLAHRHLQRQQFKELWQHDKFVDAKLEKNPEIAQLGQQVRVEVQGRDIPIDIWGKLIEGKKGAVVPILLLSSANCGENGFERISDRVYPGKHDWFATLGQEILLGIGGVKALRELNVDVETHHINDGHPALVAAQKLIDRGVTPESFNEAALNRLRQSIVFSSHTLVGAAADMFFPDTVNNMVQNQTLRRLVGILGAQPVDGQLKAHDHPMVMQGALDMAGMAMFSAGKIYAVSKLNGELLKEAFPQHADRIGGGITNAVHPSWAAQPLADLYGEAAPGWEEKPEELGRIEELREDSGFRKKLWSGHMEAKLALVDMVSGRKEAIAKAGLDPDIFARDLDPNWFTMGFARRVAGYKRHNLIAHDLEALVASIAHDHPVQFVFAGKAHPMDENPGGGKDILRSLLRAGERLNKEYSDRFRFVFLPDYDVRTARQMIPGVDLWLNNPIWGQEASGTSTMDAILNGVLLLTTDDGCIPEMRERGGMGWVFGRRNHPQHNGNYEADAYALYGAMSAATQSYYYSMNSGAFESGGRSLWTDKMIDAISKVAPYFLSPRMVQEYATQMWNLSRGRRST